MKSRKVSGWILLAISIGFFGLQMASLFLQKKFQMEYSDNRLFYMINIVSIVCLSLAIYLLLTFTKKTKIIGAGIVLLFIGANIVLLINSNQTIKNIVSLSPDWKNVLSIKVNPNTGEAIVYRSYYWILARPMERLPYPTSGEFKVDWLADDVAAVTYKADDQTIHQYIGTYGDRGGGSSYYYVGPSIYGQWTGKNADVISNQEGITVKTGGKTEQFDWEHVVQFGTLAVVLTANNQAVWTISLDENFIANSNAAKPPKGYITLYKATMEETNPIKMFYLAEKQ